MRLALGASRARLFTQTLIEGLLLSLLALIVSMPLIAIGLGLSRASIPLGAALRSGLGVHPLDVPLFLATALLGTRGDGGVLALAGDAGDAGAGVRYAAAVRAQR